MMRIAFFSHSGGQGGAERALIELVSGLQDRGVACLVFLPRLGVLANDLKAAGIDYVVAPYAWWMSGRKNWTVIKFGKALFKIFANLLVLPKIIRHLRH